MKLYVAAVALVGCAQSSSPVTAQLAYRYPDGTTVPMDLSHEQYQVLVENGDGYDRYPDQPVVGTVEGTFEIPDVPDGPYWLEASAVGSASYPTLSHQTKHELAKTDDVLGRSDDTPVAAPTPLMVDATNMNPWAASDVLYIDCFENATEASTPMFTPALATGAQEIHGSFDWSGPQDVYSFGVTGRPYLMRAGDHVTVSHETEVQTTPVSTYRLTQVLTTDAPAQTSGQSATITGAFVDVPATEQLSITVDPTFAGSSDTSVSWYVTAVAGLGTAQGYTIGPNLFEIFQPAPLSPVTTTVSYGNPFDPSWTPLLQVNVQRQWTLGNSTFPISIAYEDRPLPAGSFTFDPLPVASNITIGGYPVGHTFDVTPGVSLPLDAHVADGTSSIGVTVWHVTDSFPAAAGYVFTDHMPIDLPAEIFHSGDRYALEIITYATDGDHYRASTATTDVFTYTAQ